MILGKFNSGKEETVEYERLKFNSFLPDIVSG
jgi:hypothetical protein